MKKYSDEKPPISTYLQIAHRYVRSVNIERDLSDPHALEGYFLTPIVKLTLERLLAGLRVDSTQKAWRVTGPYGAGKSAFGLFLASLLFRSNGRLPQGRAKLLESFPEQLAALDDIPRYMPLPINGRRLNFADALADGLYRTLGNNSARGRNPHVLKEIALFKERRLEGKAPDDSVIQLLIDFARYVQQSRLPYDGVILIVDEMGKFLEYIALNPGKADTLVFQNLAEATSGRTEMPLAVVAFLHHHFADYAFEYGPRIQEEWEKVAERFEEIPFQESMQQYVFLLGNAMQFKEPQPKSSGITKRAQALYRYAASKRGILPFKRLPELVQIAANLYPIHPTVLAALTPAIQRFGQNERSLFSFLVSHEPFGFQQFIESRTVHQNTWYRLPDLYDYVAANSSLRIRDGDRRRRWELLEDNLRMAEPLTAVEIEVLKSVGLLNVLEPIPGLKTDSETVGYALRDKVSAPDVGKALKNLIDKGFLFRRKLTNDHCLWSHSSVDLQAFYDQAQRRVPPLNRLDNFLRELPATRPLVAHRHYLRTGTLRAFGVRILSDVNQEFFGTNTKPPEYDGEILLLPVYPDQQFSSVQETVRKSETAQSECHLFYLREVTQGDLAVARELGRWQWVSVTCEDLRADDLARREVNRRLDELKRELLHRLEDFRLSDFHGSGTRRNWIHLGEHVDIPNRLILNRKLSEICDEIYPAAPIIKNELINREKLSTAVASARNNLIKLILENEGKEYLGIVKGMPPEKAIYLSAFHTSGLHRNEAGRRAFRPPTEDDPCRWRPVWNGLRSLLEQSRKIKISEVLKFLNEPPYGLRQGPAILLIAIFLQHYREELLLFEKGTFQIRVTEHHFMRMMKNLDNFSLHYSPMRRDKPDLMEIYSNEVEILKGAHEAGSALPNIAASIYKWFIHLPAYTMNTGAISNTAKEIRLALKKATDPVDMLYDLLPRTCGIEQGFASPGFDIEEAKAFVERLNESFTELNSAFDRLHAEVGEILLSAFSASGGIPQLRELLVKNYLPFSELLSDHRLKSFLIRAGNNEVSDENWIESVASLLTGRSLANWQDNTLEEFRVEVKDIATRIRRWAAILVKATDFERPPGELIGIHIVSQTGEERAFTVHKNASLPPKLETLKEKVKSIISDEPEAPMVLTQVLSEILENTRSAESKHKKNDGKDL